MTIEQLTDEEWERIRNGHGTEEDGIKAVSLIDAHAADRAALVARHERELTEASANFTGSQQQLKAEEVRRIRIDTERAALAAQVAELTRERDSWRRTAETLTRERDEAHLETANQLLEWHRGLLDELRQLCFDTDADPKPQWNVARDMNRLLTIGQKIDAARAGCQTPAPTHAALVAQVAEAAKKKRATCSLNSACSAPLRQGLHSIMKVDGIKLCTVCGASEPRPEEDAGPDGEADPDYPPHREHFAPTHAALVAQVAELTRERDEARAIAERECCCGDNFQPVSGPHDCVAGSGQAALVAQLEAAERANAEGTALLAAAERTVSQLNEMNDRENSRTSTAVGDLQYANRRCDELLSRAEAAEAQVAELTRERGSWRRTAETLTRERDEARGKYEALSRDRALVALVERAEAAEADRDVWRRRSHAGVTPELEALESEVTRLTEALAAAERSWRAANGEKKTAEARARELTEAQNRAALKLATAYTDLNAAESECAALRAEVGRLRAQRDHWKEQRDLERADWEGSVAQKQAAESRLAAANALLGEISESNNTGRSWRGAIRAHLRAQPATAPARKEVKSDE